MLQRSLFVFLTLYLLYVSAQNVQFEEGGGQKGVPKVISRNQNSVTQLQETTDQKDDNPDLQEVLRAKEQQIKNAKEEDLKRNQAAVNDRKVSDIQEKIKQKMGRMFLTELDRSQEQAEKAQKEDQHRVEEAIINSKDEDKLKFEVHEKNVEEIEELNKQRITAEKFRLDGLREQGEKRAREMNEKGGSEGGIKEEASKRRAIIEEDAKRADSTLRKKIQSEKEAIENKERETAAAAENTAKSVENKDSEARKKLDDASAIIQEQTNKKASEMKQKDDAEQNEKEQKLKEQQQKEQQKKEQQQKEQNQKEQTQKEQSQKEQSQKANAEGKWCQCFNSNQNWQGGWSYNNCPDGYLFAGWYRDGNTQNLRSILQYKCCKPCRDDGSTVMGVAGCFQANWWGSFDRQQWSTCPDNYYIQGFLKNNCDLIYCLEEARCCRIDGSRGRKNCNSKDSWWSSFDREGWSVLDDNQFAFALFRTGDHNLYNIESPYQCTFYQY